MDIESAIEQLELAIGLIDQNSKDWLDERDIPVLEKAIEVCKKEVPKKVVLSRDFNTVKFYCPTCGNHPLGGKSRCSECGQVIDWSEEDE